MEEKEVDWFVCYLGYDICVYRDFYWFYELIIEIVKVSKLFFIVD